METPLPQRPFVLVNYVAALLAAAAALVYFKVVIIGAILGAGLGVLIAPVWRRVHASLTVQRSAGAVSIVLVELVVLAGLIACVLVITEPQIQGLADLLPQVADNLIQLFDGLASRYPWLDDAAHQAGTRLLFGARTGVTLLGISVFAFVIGLYLALDAEGYYHALLQSLPLRNREAAASFLDDSAGAIRHWFRKQLTDLAVCAPLVAAGLLVVGMKYWLVFGLFMALLGIFPYLGIAIVATFAGLVTLADAPTHLPLVLAVFVIAQQLKSRVILPLMLGDLVVLPAVPLLVFMLMLGTWAGLLGVLMAPPLFSMLLVAYHRFYLPRMGGVPEIKPPA